MSTAITNSVLSEEFWSAEGSALWVKRVVLVVLGIAALAISAKIKFPIPYSPVPITMGTFVVLTIGSSYGPRMGLATIVGYMLIGALGFDVFANSAAGTTGIEYMMGGTGGFLVGFVLATLALGYAARRAWDRNVAMMAVAMLVGSIIIYVPGVMWLAHLYTWEQAFAWGLTPFLVGDALKLALAALLVPAVWKMVGRARG
jgi:biotin transport system substrate-specific component